MCTVRQRLQPKDYGHYKGKQYGRLKSEVTSLCMNIRPLSTTSSATSQPTHTTPPNHHLLLPPPPSPPLPPPTHPPTRHQAPRAAVCSPWRVGGFRELLRVAQSRCRVASRPVPVPVEWLAPSHMPVVGAAAYLSTCSSRWAQVGVFLSGSYLVRSVIYQAIWATGRRLYELATINNV